ncbi:tetracycline resistance protein [Xanthomonas citri pv. punicae str. LMG 859]|nr:tetracycline resistance protein [Xanthomonas citri pv. punicae str. LMG 859]
MIGFIIYGLADSGTAFLIGVPISALWAIAAPSAQALITREVGADAQGRVQGALTGLVSLAGIVGPLLFANVFAWFIGSGCAAASAGRAVVAGCCPAGRRLGHGLETGRARRRHHTRGADVKPTYSACARVCFF